MATPAAVPGHPRPGLIAPPPSALNVFVLVRQYNVWVEQASGAVPLGTLLSVATLTSVMWLVQQGGLPQSVIP